MVLFSNKEPNNFSKYISTLNEFLIFHHNERTEKLNCLSRDILSSSSIVKQKSMVSVDRGLDKMFGYLTKTFKVRIHNMNILCQLD